MPILAAMFLLPCMAANGQQLSEKIRLNQVGFYPAAPKKAVIQSSLQKDVFYITTASRTDTVFKGKLSPEQKVVHSGKPVRVADFSSFNKEGKYVLVVPGVGHSYAFDIGPQVNDEVVKASIKAFYFQRASAELKQEQAGKWARPAGHPDQQVLIHASAADKIRPEGSVIASPGGWYDAGDYNKYIVNSGITMATLFSAYEDFPAYFKTLPLNIPESKNAVPDLLDEALWNLRWMLTMQDPTDGGVYHKLTNPEFDAMDARPADANGTRYVVKKTTAAALNFAAVMAQAHRVFKGFERDFPDLADSCLVASRAAWNWAGKNPSVLYKQPEMNKQFDPDINTGAYDDNEVSDEFTWAAAELYLSTKEDSYYKAIKLVPQKDLLLPTWNQVRLLGYYSLVRFEKELTPAARKDMPIIKKALTGFADKLVEAGNQNAYRVVMGTAASDFVWGSSAVAANQGIALLQAYNFTRNKKYLDAALSNLDYLLGRNATGYSFLTGYGDKTPMYPHHRLSESDNVPEPVPGLLVGGPNPGQQDKCNYPTKVADESYIDDVCSYASNEIAINWNAPFVYLAAGIEALKQQAGYTQASNTP